MQLLDEPDEDPGALVAGQSMELQSRRHAGSLARHALGHGSGIASRGTDRRPVADDLEVDQVEHDVVAADGATRRRQERGLCDPVTLVHPREADVK